MYIARFKNGVLSGYNHTPKTLEEMQAIKAGENCLEISQTDYENLEKGASASLSGDVVTVTLSAEQQSAYELGECLSNRRAEYPDYRDYLDAIVKGDDAQKQKYIDDCLAVKAKYPKN